MEGRRNHENAKSDNLRLVLTSPMIEVIALCREKQSNVESSHETNSNNTDNDEEDQTPEDDRSDISSNNDGIETDEQSGNESDPEVHRESCTMSDDEIEQDNKKEFEEGMEYYESDTESCQFDDSIKEAGFYVTSIANLRRREMH